MAREVGEKPGVLCHISQNKNISRKERQHCYILLPGQGR